MRNRFVVVAAFTTAAAGHAMFAAAQFVEGTHRIHALAPNIYAAQPRFGGSTATFIVDDARVVVFDPHSTPAQAGALIEEIRNRTDAPVRLVINSHWHADHHGGNSAFVRAFPGVELLTHRETLAAIPTRAVEQLKSVLSFYRTFVQAARGAVDAGAVGSVTLSAAQRGQITRYADAEAAFLDDPASQGFTLATTVVTGDTERTASGSGTSFKILALRGHTEADLAVYIPTSRLLLAGDLLTFPIVVTHSSYPAAWARSLRAIEALDVDRIVTGHGGPVVDKAFVRTMRELLEAIVSEVRAAREAGSTVEQSVIRVRESHAVRQATDRVQWDQPGITFLDRDRFIDMTVPRAFAEGPMVR